MPTGTLPITYRPEASVSAVRLVPTTLTTARTSGVPVSPPVTVPAIEPSCTAGPGGRFTSVARPSDVNTTSTPASSSTSVSAAATVIRSARRLTVISTGKTSSAYTRLSPACREISASACLIGAPSNAIDSGRRRTADRLRSTGTGVERSAMASRKRGARLAVASSFCVAQMRRGSADNAHASPRYRRAIRCIDQLPKQVTVNCRFGARTRTPRGARRACRGSAQSVSTPGRSAHSGRLP